jgi:hypothetical protein
LTEGQFWKELRSRINHRAPDDDPIPLPGWCDWFEPKSYSAGHASARVVGRVLFVKGADTFRWRFTLLLNQIIRSFEDLDWAELEHLLPQSGETGWLTVDGERLTIELPPPERNV